MFRPTFNACTVSNLLHSLRASSGPVPILAILVPFSLDEGAPASIPPYLASPSSTGPKIVLAAVYTKFSAQAVEALQWAIERGFTVDLAIETNLRAGEGAWEDIDDLLSKTLVSTTKGNIILCKFLLVDQSMVSLISTTHSQHPTTIG